MSLLAYNLTVYPLNLAAGSPIVKLPPADSVGGQGPAFNVTGELKLLSPADYALLQTQVASGWVEYEWTGLPEYDTHTLVVGKPSAVVSEEVVDEFPVLFRLVSFDDPEQETGADRAIRVPLPEYDVRVLQVSAVIRRGAPDAQVYLCDCPSGIGNGDIEQLSDRFDASQPGMVQETSTLKDRVLLNGSDLFACVTHDHVRGQISILLQRAS